MYDITCPVCGCLVRRELRALIIVNAQVIQPDDLDEGKVRVCANPICRAVF
jgi:hypothetical protein